MNENIHERIGMVNVWWEEIKLHVPIYLIRGGQNALVDAGPPQRSQGGLSSTLEPFGVALADIDLLLLTHGHLDHVGGIAQIKAGSRAQILIHGEDTLFLEDGSRAFDQFYGVGTRLLSGKEDLREEKEAFLKGAGPDLVPDRRLEDDHVINLGDGIELRVVHVPGHTKGSVGYYWEKEEILIAGDAIPALGGPDGSLPIITDLVDYGKSIDRLLQMPLRVLVFTHAYRGLRLPPSTVRRGEEIREYLLDSKEVADRLVEVLRRESAGRRDRPFLATADRVIAGLPEEMRFAPIAKQFSPQFSVSTIFWGFSRVEAGR